MCVYNRCLLKWIFFFLFVGRVSGSTWYVFECVLELISTLTVFHSFRMDTKGKSQHWMVSVRHLNHCSACQNPHNGCFIYWIVFIHWKHSHENLSWFCFTSCYLELILCLLMSGFVCFENWVSDSHGYLIYWLLKYTLKFVSVFLMALILFKFSITCINFTWP